MKLAVLTNYKTVGKNASGDKHFASGFVNHVTINNIDDLAKNIFHVANTDNKCLSVGVFSRDGKITTNHKDNFLHRVADEMEYGNVLVIDNDIDIPFDINIFSKYWADFDQVGYVQTRSASTLAGKKKYATHTYFLCDGVYARETLQLMEAIFILEGLYKVEFHKTGRAVVKTPVDIKLSEKQQPIYEEDTKPLVKKGYVFDLSERPKGADRLINRANRLKKKLIDENKEKSLSLHADFLTSQGINRLNDEQIELSYASYATHEINETQELYSKGNKVGTVGDLLLGKNKETLFADIHEPDYDGGKQKAKFYGQVIHSQAHGGVTYIIKVSYRWYQENHKNLIYEPYVCDKTLDDYIYAEMSDEDIHAVLSSCKGAVEQKKYIKKIQKATKLSQSDIKDAYSTQLVADENGLNKVFKGAKIFWEPMLGSFIEYNAEKNLYRQHRKNNFYQTLMSATGETATFVNKLLPNIPLKYIEYNPTTEHKSKPDSVNIYRSVKFPDLRIDVLPYHTFRLLNHLFLDDLKAKEVFLNWLATIMQTGIRTGVAWAFYGEQGTGKGILCEIIRHLLGSHNCSMNIGDSSLQSNFNGYAKHKQFIQLNEISSAYHHRHGVAGKLKALITDPIIQINEKGIESYEVENFANIVLNSNQSNPIELDMGDRRWNMIKTNKPLLTTSWFKGLETVKRIMAEVEAFGCWLLNYPIDKTKATVPMEVNEAKQAVIVQTSSPLKQVGKLIKNLDFNGLCDMLTPDNEFSLITTEDIHFACKTKFFSSNLLNRIYCNITGKTNINGRVVNNYLVIPFITQNQSYTVRLDDVSVRGYFIGDVKNAKAVFKRRLSAYKEFDIA